MRDVKMETAVGLFMMIGIACLAWLSIRLGNVEIAGVEIGTIESIGIRDYKAVVRMAIRKDIALQEDAIASIRSRGLIGDKYVSISPGASDRLIPPGGKIRETEPPVDIEKLIGQVIHGKADSGGDAK